MWPLLDDRIADLIDSRCLLSQDLFHGSFLQSLFGGFGSYITMLWYFAIANTPWLLYNRVKAKD